MARLSISEAIRQSPIGKSQFYAKYIDGGVITVSVDNAGKKYIDSSELLRVFGGLKGGNSEQDPKQSEMDATGLPNFPDNNNQLEVIKLLKEQLSDSREREKYYQTQIASLTNRLEGPVSQPNPFTRWWRGLK